MLVHLAAKQQTTIGHLIAHELDDLVTGHLEERRFSGSGGRERFRLLRSVLVSSVVAFLRLRRNA